MSQNNLISIKSRLPVPIWICTGLRSVDRDAVLGGWPGVLGGAQKYILTMDEILHEYYLLKNGEKVCYHCLASILVQKVERLVEQKVLQGKTLILEYSPQLSLYHFLDEVDRVTGKEKPFVFKGIFHALNEYHFLSDFNGENGLAGKNYAMAESLSERVELATLFVVSKPDREFQQKTRDVIRSLRDDACFVDIQEFQKLDESFFFQREFSRQNCQENIYSLRLFLGKPEEKFVGELYESDRAFQFARFSQVAENWPATVLRSTGRVWLYGRALSLYQFSQVGENMVAVSDLLCSSCGGFSGKGTEPLSWSRLALVSSDTQAVKELAQMLDWAKMTDFECRLMKKNEKSRIQCGPSH